MNERDQITWQEIVAIPHTPGGWAKAVERFGFDAVANPAVHIHSGPIPSPCRQRRRSVGLGDLIKRLTSAFGVKPCSACEERARKLNRVRVRGLR